MLLYHLGDDTSGRAIWVALRIFLFFCYSILFQISWRHILGDVKTLEQPVTKSTQANIGWAGGVKRWSFQEGLQNGADQAAKSKKKIYFYRFSSREKKIFIKVFLQGK